MKKFSIVLAMLLVVALAVPTFANPFTDVPANHWAYNAVNKLVAAGIVEGYPDGTYKGQNNMTRYEIAVIVARALDNVAAERAVLADKVEAAKAGLSSEQAQDVTAIVKALMEKNQPEQAKAPAGLTDQQADEVANLIEALTFEFKAELKTMGAKVDALGTDVADLDARVTALENATPEVSFSGSYSVKFTSQSLTGASDKSGVDYYWLEYAPADVDAQFGDADGSMSTAERKLFIKAVEAYFADNFPANSDYTIGGVDVTVKAENEDAYVYSNPWDDDSDTIATDVDNEFDQELSFAANIAKDGFAATLDIAADEDEDEWDIASMGLNLENDFLKASYSDENTVSVADYVFNDTEFDGVNVEFKDYGVNAFAGIADVAAVDPAEVYTEETMSREQSDAYGYVNDDDNDPWEKDVVKFDKDSLDGSDNPTDDLVAQTEDDTTDYYVYGAQKDFNLGQFDVLAKFAGRRQVADKDMMTNVLGLETSTDLSGIGVNFDMVYSMDKELDQSDSLLRLGLSNDFDLASVDFNYRSVGDNFTFLDEDPVLTDDDEDAYDLFTTESNPGVNGYDLTIKPKLMEGLDASVFYASVNDGQDNSKLALSGKYPVMDGLTVNAKYEDVKKDDKTDETKTTSFGAEYALMEGATATFDYKVVDPVENDLAADVTPATVAKDKESTMSLGLEYALNDYVTANANYEKVTNLDYLKTFAGKDMEKTTTGFGIDLADYPLYSNLTASAGFSYENVTGYGYDVDEYDDYADQISLDDLNVKTTGITAGLGYTVGAADFTYDLGYTKKTGTGVGGPGTGAYTTHKLGLVYGLTDTTDLNADYEILDMNADDNTEDYQVRTATASVSIDF